MDTRGSFILINVGVLGLFLFLRKPWRTICGLVAGLVLFSTSLFHLLFGEGSIHDPDHALYSWPWWSDTYEVTVLATYVFLLLLYSWSVKRPSAMIVPNLAYLATGGVYFWLLSPKADGITVYNALGLFIGSMWMMERFFAKTVVAKRHTPEEDSAGKPLVATV